MLFKCPQKVSNMLFDSDSRRMPGQEGSDRHDDLLPSRTGPTQGAHSTTCLQKEPESLPGGPWSTVIVGGVRWAEQRRCSPGSPHRPLILPSALGVRGGAAWPQTLPEGGRTSRPCGSHCGGSSALQLPMHCWPAPHGGSHSILAEPGSRHGDLPHCAEPGARPAHLRDSKEALQGPRPSDCPWEGQT